MTWKINTQTGELFGPDGDLRTTLEKKPLKLPDDVQEWAGSEFRGMTLDQLSTNDLADFAELWVGDIDVIDE